MDKTNSEPLYIDNPIYYEKAYNANHPLAIERLRSVRKLCEQMGWLDIRQSREAIPASKEILNRYHDAAYIDALQQCDERNNVPRRIRERYNFGNMENPMFSGVFTRASTTVGGSILAAELALEGRKVFHPAGGTHHGQYGNASGFCYFNDPVFAIGRLLDDKLKRVLYVDLDAHHGDGVEAAFCEDSRVYLLSIHEQDKWPHSGSLNEKPNKRICNLPVPENFNDSEFQYLLERTMLPFAKVANPEAIVVTCGADALAGDPLSSMQLSNFSLWRAVMEISSLSDVVVVLGGGGYNPWTVARCWSGLWAKLTASQIQHDIPEGAIAILQELDSDLVDEEDVLPCWVSSVEDPKLGEQHVRPALESLVKYYQPTVQ